jgi:osmotically-inducible protein OsmY
MAALSDQEIAGAVIAALAGDGRVDMSDIVHVSVDSGVVLLSGTVWSAEQKLAATEITRGVHGVVDVQNDLTVAVEGEISDAELREAVLAALAGNPELVRRVGCTVDDGIVTLVGHVRDSGDEQRAIHVAGTVHGVEQVISALEIAEIVPDETVPPIDDATLVGKVADALDCAGIQIEGRVIEVDQGVATVRGKVKTVEDQRRVRDIVASVDGIRAVHARLVLRRSEESADPDEALAARVIHALTRDGRVSPSNLQVVADNGVVTITGQVDSVDDQTAVAEVARSVPGARRVDNRVLVLDRTSARSGDKGVHGRPRPYRR